MSYLSSVARLIVASGVFTVAALGQDAQQILRQVAETYQNLKSYHFQGVSLSEANVDGKRSTAETPFDIAFASPNKLKVEYRYPGGDSWIRVSDGVTLVRYRSPSGDLRREPASRDDLKILKGTFISDFGLLARTTSSARVVGSETLSVGGKDIDCYVVEAQQQRVVPDGTKVLPTKWWIDKARSIIAKQVTATSSAYAAHTTVNSRTVSFTLARANEELPRTLFQFEPAMAAR
jgi:outer membrane lipoprotein-sorting protein